MRKHSVAIHGTGFIGLVSGCCFATKGFKAINSTFNVENCEQINQGESPFFENGLSELLKELLNYLSAHRLNLGGREDDNEIILSEISTIGIIILDNFGDYSSDILDH